MRQKKSWGLVNRKSDFVRRGEKEQDRNASHGVGKGRGRIFCGTEGDVVVEKMDVIEDRGVMENKWDDKGKRVVEEDGLARKKRVYDEENSDEEKRFWKWKFY